MKKAILVGVMAAQALLAQAGGERHVSCAWEHVGRGLHYLEQLREGGKDAGLMAARARTEFMLASIFDSRNSEAYYQLGCLYRDVFGYNEQAMEQFMLFVRLSDESDGRRKQVLHKVLPEVRKKISLSIAELPGISTRDSTKCEEELKKADACMKNGELDDATMHYKAAYGADPLSFNAANGLARSLESSGHGKDALNYYRTACLLKPQSAAVFVKTGELAMEQGMPAVAADAFSRAVATLPRSHAAVEALADALHKLKREDEARAYRLYLTEIQRGVTGDAVRD